MSGQDAALKRNLAALDAILAGQKAGKSKGDIVRQAMQARTQANIEHQAVSPIYRSANTLTPGQKMPDGTVYIGMYKPIDFHGKCLSKMFNIFAAPEDLPEPMKYADSVRYISELKDWHGYDGENYATAREIFNALSDDSYSGGWIIPMREILCGKDGRGHKTMKDNMLYHKDEGALKDTFKMECVGDAAKMAGGGDVQNIPYLYWSSTRYYATDHVWTSRLESGQDGWLHMDNHRLSCRPVRLVEVKP